MFTITMRTVGLMGSLMGLVLIFLPSCDSSVSTTDPSPAPAKTTTTTTAVASSPSISPNPSPNVQPSASPATIAEILRQPVWVRPPNTPQDVAAQEGMGLQVGETVRTQDEAMAQIDFSNGLAFRLGKNSLLTIQPNNRLNLQSGDMITWVQPGQKLPAEITTPTAIAGIRGTTVFVKIPPDPKEGTLFFAWEGEVVVRLPNQQEEILLKTGDEVRIWQGERDIRRIRRRIRRLKSQEWQQRLRTDRLLRGFKTPLPTLKTIEILKPGQVAP